MAYKHPYNDDLRKVPLNSEMIRHRVAKNAQHDLLFSFGAGLFMTFGCGAFLALFCPNYSWDSGALPLVFGILLTVAFAAGVVMGILLFASAIRNRRRAARGEVLIEMDTVTYIERDRPRKDYSRRHHYTVYEDFLHFKSGREFKDIDRKYRHMDIDDEVFITVAYAAEPHTILFIYRLADYTWQE